MFQMRHNTNFSRGWLYAWSIHPRSPLSSNFCDQCGRGSEIPSGEFDVDLEGGSKYPDILQCGAYPFLIVSERVVTDWREAGITCFDAYKVCVASVKPKKARLAAPPLYFRIELTGTCVVEPKASGMKISRRCSKCGTGDIDRDNAKPFAIVPGSWNDFPLFRDAKLLPRVSFCNEQVFKLAKEKNHTNFRFEVAIVAGGAVRSKKIVSRER